MRCIFCLKERPGSEEHVFPLAIGGSLITDRVCEPCNSTLGSRVDAALSDNFAIRIRRGQLGLAGNSRTAPGQFEILTGVAQLADGSGKRIHASLNEATGKLDLRALHHATDIDLPDGRKIRQITIDERDIDQIPTIIQRERKRHGLPPLSQEDIAVEVEKAKQTLTSHENPEITKTFSVNYQYLRHAMMKIAYELAFLWLGESYLDDPMAAQLREAVCKADFASTDEIPGYVGEASGCSAFPPWISSPTEHLAVTSTDGKAILLAVRVFDIYAAVIPVSLDAARYLAGQEDRSKLKFLAMESTTGKLHVSTFIEEAMRLASVHLATGIPLPLPLPSPLSVQPEPPPVSA